MKKVLIVDDSPDTRLVLKTLLSKYDVEVIEAIDGLDGWKKIVQEHPDLILLDIHMPIKDGFDILDDLEEEWLNIPVVVVSGDEEQDTERSVRFHGAKAFLHKPIKKNEFEEALKILSA